MGHASLAKEKLGRTVLQIAAKHTTVIAQTTTVIINRRQRHLVMAIYIIESLVSTGIMTTSNIQNVIYITIMDVHCRTITNKLHARKHEM